MFTLLGGWGSPGQIVLDIFFVILFGAVAVAAIAVPKMPPSARILIAIASIVTLVILLLGLIGLKVTNVFSNFWVDALDVILVVLYVMSVRAIGQAKWPEYSREIVIAVLGALVFGIIWGGISVFTPQVGVHL